MHKQDSFLEPANYVLNVPRALRALVPHVPRALHALVPYVPSVLRALVPHVPCVLRAPVLHVPRALRVFMPHVFCTSPASCPMWPYASRFMNPFSLGTLLSHTLRTLCANTTFCALKFPCLPLLFFCLFATWDFGGGIY